MLTFQVENQLYRVSFDHVVERGTTYADLYILHPEGDHVCIASHKAITNFKYDQFRKAAGRRIALHRLLCDNFDRPTRRRVWELYWSKTSKV